MSAELIGIIGGQGTKVTGNIAEYIRREATIYRLQKLPRLDIRTVSPLLALNEDGTISDPPRASQGLLKVVEELAPQCGCFIVAACAPHLSEDQIRLHSTGSEFLSMVGITLDAVSKKPDLVKVGVIGYGSTTLTPILYQARLEKLGREFIMVDDFNSRRVDQAIDDFVENPTDPYRYALAFETLVACKRLLKKGAQAIVLACTELPLVLHLLEDMNTRLNFDVTADVLINPNQLIAEAAVARVVSLLPT